MRVRRCAILYLEPRERVEFDLAGLLAGRDGAVRRREWSAHAGHLARPVAIDSIACECLGQLSPQEWVAGEALAAWPDGMLDQLLGQGLVIAEEDAATEHARRDGSLRIGSWWGPAALFHRSSRWEGEDAAAATEAAGLSTAVGLRTQLGVPPPATVERCDPSARIALQRVEATGFDALLQQRTTCRNFDTGRALPQPLLAQMLARVFAAQGQWRMDDETVFLKKSSPSGGGLHPTEAYLIVQNVDGLAPGLYHYHPVHHALEPMASPEGPPGDLALRAVAGQHWFANAPVLLVMAARFARCFWKYRQHPKAYRAVTMDAGHLSQTLYLSATDLGLGAFVTCAINELDIEQAFGLDPLEEAAMAVCGFGWRGDEMRNAEFDPAGRVWPEPLE
jgi:putative peptide maturation dehydrogenase